MNGKMVCLKESSCLEDSYVPLEKVPSKVIGVMNLSEVSNKPLFCGSEERKVVVLNRKVENASFHHNGYAIADIEEVKVISMTERLISLFTKKRMVQIQ